MAFNVNDIRSRLALGGARPTLFRARLNLPAGFAGDVSDAEFMIQASSIPPSTIQPIEVPYFGRTIRVAGDRTFEPWTVQVINDESFKIRQAMETWHNRINSLSGNLNTTGSSAPSNYKTQADIQQFAKSGQVIRTYRFYGLFPIEISAIELGWEQRDTIETFNVTFVYDWYEVVGPSVTGTVA